jgi:ion channel-forming bestrophin family protein
MYTGKNYGFIEVLFWTRRDIIKHLIIAAVPTFCYIVLGWHWLSIPWLPIALLGTAVAFVVGFANNASYDRMWEARKAWGSIVNASRSWGIMVKDYITVKHSKSNITDVELELEKQKIIHYHIAWMTALRFQLREERIWEAIYEKTNQEYKNKWFKVHEHENELRNDLLLHLSKEDVDNIMSKTNKAAQILGLQSSHLKVLLDKGLLDEFKHIELEKMLVEFYTQQGVSERIKNTPYPRQYATVNLYFIRIFMFLIPLGMLQEFAKMGGHLIWLCIPFSALSSWVFTTMEKIGQSTESPFEGSANDVPITAISRNIEIDLMEMFNMSNIPKSLK